MTARGWYTDIGGCSIIHSKKCYNSRATLIMQKGSARRKIEMSLIYETVILVADKELTRSTFESLLLLVSREKQLRIKRYHAYRDAQNALLGDVLARMLICRATGRSNKQLEFTTNEYGKPSLITDTHIHYNISHAGHCIACAIDDEPVGIDIERIKPIDIKIAERFFAPDEILYITSLKDNLLVRRFYEVWTKKESRIKYEGKGLSKPLPSFSVCTPTDQDVVFYHEVFCNDEYIGNVCSSKQEKPPVRVIDITILH